MNYSKNKYSNNFLKEGDIIELKYFSPLRVGKSIFAKYEVRFNPCWISDLVIYEYGDKKWVYDGQYKSQDKDINIKKIRNCIYKVYRQNKKGDLICIYNNINCKSK